MFGRRRQVSRHRNRPLHAHTTYARIRRSSGGLARRRGSRAPERQLSGADLHERPLPTQSVRERGDDQGVADVVRQLFATEEAFDKLGARASPSAKRSSSSETGTSSSETSGATQIADSEKRVGCSSASQTASV